MRRTFDEQERVRAAARDPHAPEVTGLDRESLEEVMRDDVFLAADGKVLPLDPSSVWPRARGGGRRA